MPKEHIKRLCIIPLCKNERFDLVHKFPTDNQRAEEWRRAINLPEINNLPLDLLRKRTICSKHFRKEDYKNIESRSLNKTAVPSLNFRKAEIVSQTIVGDVIEKCQDERLINAVNVGGDRLIECRILTPSKRGAVTSVPNNNGLFTLNVDVGSSVEDKNLVKYVYNTVDTTIPALKCEGGPSPKYRLIQSTQVQVIETQLDSIPVTKTLDGKYLPSLVPVLTAPHIEESISLIDQSSQQLDFLTTKNTVDFMHDAHSYVNEIVQQLESPYISKYLYNRIETNKTQKLKKVKNVFRLQTLHRTPLYKFLEFRIH